MKNDASELLAKALKLPAEARAALAGSLIESLDETIDEDISHAAISFLCGISPKSNGPMKLLPWPTAEGNLATGRTASRAEERATWPANQRLERMAKKGRLVFPRLVSEGWLKVDELAGIGTEKVDVIN